MSKKRGGSLTSRHGYVGAWRSFDMDSIGIRIRSRNSHERTVIMSSAAAHEMVAHVSYLLAQQAKDKLRHVQMKAARQSGRSMECFCDVCGG